MQTSPALASAAPAALAHAAAASGPLATEPPARDRAHQAATRFEAVFVQQMVAAMRSSADGLGGGMFGSDAGSDTYAAWFDGCMAERIASGSGIGLARLIEKELVAHTQPAEASHD